MLRFSVLKSITEKLINERVNATEIPLGKCYIVIFGVFT